MQNVAIEEKVWRIFYSSYNLYPKTFLKFAILQQG